MSNLLTLRGTGKIAMVDGATDQSEWTAGTKRILTFREITIDPQIERQQSKVEDVDGTLTVGDSYINFSALRIGIKTNRATAESLTAFLLGTKVAPAEDYHTITPMAAGQKNRSGALKLDFYHPELGSAVPAITGTLIFYKAFAPDGTITATSDGDALTGFMFDYAGGALKLHDMFATQFPAS